MKLVANLVLLSHLLAIFTNSAWAVPATHFNDVAIQNSLAVGQTGTANTKSVLELVSTTKGFLPPRMTTTQKNAISSPPAGLILFDSTLSQLQIYTGTAWAAAGGGGISYAADTGSANAYAIAPTSPATAYTAGDMYAFKATNSNTTSSTLNVSSLGTKNIKTPAIANLPANAIQANTISIVVYDGTQFQLVNQQDPTRVSPLITKGDMHTYSTVDARQAVPGDYGRLIPDSGASTGWRSASYTQFQNGTPTINYVQYSDFENNATTGWSAVGCATLTAGYPACNGSAGADFSSSNGGRAKGANTTSPAIDSSSAVGGTYAMNLATSAAGTAGDGYISSAYTIDPKARGKTLGYSVSYKVASGTPVQGGTSADTYAVAIYSPAENLWLTLSAPFCVTQSSGVGTCEGTFVTSASTTKVQYFVYSPVAPAGASSLLFDDTYVGKSFSLSNLNQSSLVASGYFAATSSCTLTRTNTALGATGTTAACPGATVETNNGPGTLQTTDYDLLKFTINSLPAGTYEVCMGGTAFIGTSSQEGGIAISDGTTTSGGKGHEWSTSGGPWDTCGVFIYTTTANQSWQPFFSSAANQITVVNNGTNEQTYFTVKRFPTASDLGYTTSNGGLAAGDFLSTAASTCPQGTIAADGTSYLRTDYPALFAAIGTTYGSADGTHFTVPDRRGVFERGAGSQTISAITYTGTQGTTQGDQIQGHFHTGNGSGSNEFIYNRGGSGIYAATAGGTAWDRSTVPGGAASTDGTNGTPRTGSETRPANISAKVCIRTVNATPAPIFVGSVTSPYVGNTTINAITTKSANYTATTSDETVVFTATSTLSLPAAANVPGKKYHVISSGASVNVTIDPNASETVCGRTTILLSGDEHGEIQSDGTNWQGLGDTCKFSGYVAMEGTCTTGTCTLTRQSGNWLTSIVHNSTGNYTITFATGVFGVAPVCSFTGLQVAPGDMCEWTSYPTTTSGTAVCYNNATTLQDTRLHLSCMGYR